MITGVAPACPVVRRLPPAVPLDGAHPVARRSPWSVSVYEVVGGAYRKQQRDHHGAALQPHEAQPGWRAGPGPHHQRRHPGPGPGAPGVPGEPRPDAVPGPGLPVPAQRDHRGEGDRLLRARGVVGIDIAGPGVAGLQDLPSTSGCSSGPGGAVWASRSTPANRDPIEEIGEVIRHLEPSRIGHGVKAAYDPRTMAHHPGARHHARDLPHQQPQHAGRVAAGTSSAGSSIRSASNGVRYTINTDGPEMLKTYIRDELTSLGRLGILSVEEQLPSAEWARQASFVAGVSICRCRAGPRPRAPRSNARKPDA